MESVRPTQLQDSITALRQRPVAATEKSFGRLAATWPVTACWLADNRPPLLGGDFLLPVLVQLTGDDRWHSRVLRAVKNRFGTLNELGFFE